MAVGRYRRFQCAAFACAALAVVVSLPAEAQQRVPQPEQAPQVAPIRPYQTVAVKPPTPPNDPSFETFRRQLADVAKRRDRIALAKMVVSRGFFWEGETGDKVDKKKSSFDNFAVSISLNDKQGVGWDILAAAAQESTLEPFEDRKGVMCGPASPDIDEKAFDDLLTATETQVDDWGFPTAADVEVRAEAQPNAPVIEKLGMFLVRVLPEEPGTPPPGPGAVAMIRVVGPTGKTGYVPADSLLPVLFDQICYVKDASGWKITGYVGGD
jgi:hypothetical protein